jgi:hypothetical protein
VEVDRGVTGTDAKTEHEIAEHRFVGVLAVDEAQVRGIVDRLARQITNVAVEAHQPV